MAAPHRGERLPRPHAQEISTPGRRRRARGGRGTRCPGARPDGRARGLHGGLGGSEVAAVRSAGRAGARGHDGLLRRRRGPGLEGAERHGEEPMRSRTRETRANSFSSTEPIRPVSRLHPRREQNFVAPCDSHYDLEVLAELDRVAPSTPSTALQVREALAICDPWWREPCRLSQLSRVGARGDAHTRAMPMESRSGSIARRPSEADSFRGGGVGPGGEAPCLGRHYARNTCPGRRRLSLEPVGKRRHPFLRPEWEPTSLPRAGTGRHHGGRRATTAPSFRPGGVGAYATTPVVSMPTGCGRVWAAAVIGAACDRATSSSFRGPIRLRSPGVDRSASSPADKPAVTRCRTATGTTPTPNSRGFAACPTSCSRCRS